VRWLKTGDDGLTSWWTVGSPASEQFRFGPWTYRPPRWQADAAAIPGGRTSHVRHGTAGVHGAIWRRGRRVAGFGTGAAAGDAGSRISSQPIARRDSRSGFMGLARQTAHSTSTRRVVFLETPFENPFRINCRRFTDAGAHRPATHSITSSAMARSDGGTVRPSMRALWWLMTSSNLLDCTTGKSAGLEPLRMRPV
jgi:hypothetical protein